MHLINNFSFRISKDIKCMWLRSGLVPKINYKIKKLKNLTKDSHIFKNITKNKELLKVKLNHRFSSENACLLKLL